MSRNIRHKSNLASPQKTVKRASRKTDNSSDDDYAGVDLISDSEEDEPDVEVVEEQAIIESAEDDGDDDSVSTPRPSVEDDDQSNWDGFSVDGSQDVLGDDLHFFDDHMARMHAPDHDTEATVWASRNMTSGSPEPRRVRFNLSDSSSTASDNDDLLYPDLFMDQDSLAPSFRRKIENDDDEGNASSDDGSYWDFEGGERLPVHDDDQRSESGVSTGSSGYESGFSCIRISRVDANMLQLMLVKQPKRKNLPRLSGRRNISLLGQFSGASPQTQDPRKR